MAMHCKMKYTTVNVKIKETLVSWTLMRINDSFDLLDFQVNFISSAVTLYFTLNPNFRWWINAVSACSTKP